MINDGSSAVFVLVVFYLIESKIEDYQLILCLSTIEEIDFPEFYCCGMSLLEVMDFSLIRSIVAFFSR